MEDRLKEAAMLLEQAAAVYRNLASRQLEESRRIPFGNLLDGSALAEAETRHEWWLRLAVQYETSAASLREEMGKLRSVAERPNTLNASS